MRTLFILLVGSSFAFADNDVRLGGPTTYTTPSPNEQYLFVMIAPRPATAEPSLDPEKGEHQKQIYAKYSATGSGLYRNDGSTDKLWGVDWYSYRVWPANDGEHLVRLHGDFPLTEKFVASKRLPDETVAEQVNGEALSFYDRGRFLRSYAVRELVHNVDGLPHSLQHVLWSADGVLTRDGDKFVMMTQEPRQIVFDLSTGKITQEKPAGLGNAQFWAVRISLGLVAFCGIIILAGWLYRQR